MAQQKFKPQEVIEGHPTEEKRNFKPDDIRLRNFGFRIERRPRKGENIWSYEGRMYKESDALLMCDAAFING